MPNTNYIYPRVVKCKFCNANAIEIDPNEHLYECQFHPTHQFKLGFVERAATKINSKIPRRKIVVPAGVGGYGKPKDPNKKSRFSRASSAVGGAGWKGVKWGPKKVHSEYSEIRKARREKIKAEREATKAAKEKAKAEREATKAAKEKSKGTSPWTVFILILILGYLAYAGYNLYEDGSLQRLLTGVEVATGETGIVESAGFQFKKLFTYIKDPSRLVYDMANTGGSTGTPLPEENIILNVRNFKARRPTYKVGEEIVFDGELVVDKITKDLDLTFNCNLVKGMQGVVDISGSEDILSLEEGDEGKYFFKCTIPTEGLEIEEKKLFKVNLTMGFENTVESRLRFATSSDKNLNVRVEPSRYDGGPVNLGLSFREREQPFKGKDDGYIFYIKLRNDEQNWNGEMNLNSLILEPLGKGVDIISEDCDYFESKSLSADAIRAINNNKQPGSDDLLNKADFSLQCSLGLEPVDYQQIQYKILRARANYNYVIKKTGVVNIEKADTTKNLEENNEETIT